MEWASLALGAVEVFSVAFFTIDFAARVVSAAAVGGDGVMRYVMSFDGFVDLFSFLPFYLALPAFGGIGALAPSLLQTLVSYNNWIGRFSCGGFCLDDFYLGVPRCKGNKVLEYDQC